MLLIILMEKKLFKRFMKTNCKKTKKTNQKEFRIEKIIELKKKRL